jgi:hypothetical protein
MLRLRAVPQTQLPSLNAYAPLTADGTFAFREIPPGTYTLNAKTIVVANGDVTGIEAPSYGYGGKAGDLASALSGPLSQSLLRNIQNRTGKNSVDCGAFGSDIPGTDAVMECIRTAMKQKRPFTIVSTSFSIDALGIHGFLGESNGTLQQFKGCAVTCDRRFDLQPCPPLSTLWSKHGALVCEPPPGAIPVWPAPETER